MRTLLVIFLLVLPAGLGAQALPTDTASKPDSTKTSRPDTTLFVPIIDTTREATVSDSVNFERHLIQNPTAALFKSLIVPGWGQIGNHRYVKAAFFAGLETWFIIEAVHYAGQANDWKKLYDAASGTDLRNRYHALYRSKYTARSKYIWYAGITTFVSIFDAYVDAHLSGEPRPEKTQKLKLSLTPAGLVGPGATLSLRF
jgi:hypothetical protein